MTSVTVLSGALGLSLGAFEDCVNLTSVSLPNTLTTIDDQAFRGCRKLSNVTIPQGVKSIGYGAFSDCVSLQGLHIPSSVISISTSDGDWRGTPFAGCTSLAAITVDTANSVYASLDDILYDKALTRLIQCPGGKTGAVVVPNSVTRIGDYAFASCAGVTSLIIPSSVTAVGIVAFASCTGLTSVSIPGSVTSIGASAFADCPNLSNISVTTTDANSATSAVVSAVNTVNARVLKQGAGTMHFNAASTRTGGTVVETGEIVVSHKDALGTGLLEVQAGARATFQTGYDTVSVTSLSLASSARLEVGTGKLAVAANGFTESDIRAKLIAGRNGGSWNGASGITSTFAGGDRSIGYRLTDGALEVAYAAPGDSNLDGVIDILDLGDILSAGKFNTGGTANWTQGDTNYDGVFDILDLSEILGTGLFNQGTYLTQGSASSAAADAGTGATFDPAMVFAALAMDSSGQTTTTKRKSL